MPSSNRVTQRDVALLAGVSQATVSTMLNGGRHLIAAETAARIEAAIAELSYSPNRFARALRTQRSMIVACVVPDLTNPFYPSLMAAVQSVLNRSDYEVVALNTGGRAAAEDAAIASTIQGRYDGLVGVFFTRQIRHFRPMIDAGAALVRIEATRKSGGAAAVDDIFVDNRAAARGAAVHLLARGHRTIAVIAGEGGPQAVRIEGYRDALASVGVEPTVWLDASFTAAGGRAATERMLQAGARPTAILAANDLMAIGAMQALADHGLTVPGDVSIVGFDDIMASALVTPPLTTVSQFQDRIGARAAELMLDRLSGAADGPGRTCEMPYQIVQRASVAALPDPTAPNRLPEEEIR